MVSNSVRNIKPPVDWNSFRYKKMDSKQRNDILLGYPVSICSADQIKIQRERFVISSTDTSQGQGKHWVTFYFPKRGSYEFFDSLGNIPEDYGVGFEKILNKKYLMRFGQLQQSTSTYCTILRLLRHEVTSGENHERHCERL